MFLQTFDTFLLYQLQEIILVFSTLFLGKFTCQTLQFYGTWVAQCIDRMTDTIDETCLVVRLLVEHTLEISIKFGYITPILDSFFQMVEHIDNLDIGTTMQRTLQTADTCSNRTVSICTGRRCYTYSKGRVVTTTMFCLDNQEKVEHTGIQFGIVLMLHHIKKVLSNREILTRMTNMETSTLNRVTVDVVCISDNGWELGYQLYALAHQIVTADVIRIRIEGVHFEHTTGQDVHDVTAFQLDDMGNRTMIKRHIIVQEFSESIQFLLIRQLAREQQEGNFLESEALLLQERSYQIIEFITTIIKFTLCRGQLTFCIALITHYITDIGQSDQHTRSIFITKSTLHIELLECILINLA